MRMRRRYLLFLSTFYLPYTLVNHLRIVSFVVFINKMAIYNIQTQHQLLDEDDGDEEPRRTTTTTKKTHNVSRNSFFGVSFSFSALTYSANNSWYGVN